MNPVEAGLLLASTAPAGPAAAAIAPPAGKDDPFLSASDADPTPAPSAEPPPPAPVAAAPDLATLLAQARAAQAELAAQPLPIANHHHRFIMNLFGG